MLVTLVFLSPGCYTLKSAAIPPDLKTINIGFFENNAQLVVANLSRDFTEGLKNRIRTTTAIGIVTGEGNANMSGAITEYRIAPVSVQATGTNTPPIAGAQQLTISVQVKFVYEKDKKINFDQTFTKSINYTGDINSQEQGLIRTLITQLIDDIFNKAFNNW